jgi:hypothetical protein
MDEQIDKAEAYSKRKVKEGRLSWKQPPAGFDPEEEADDFLIWAADQVKGKREFDLDAYGYLKLRKKKHLTDRHVSCVVDELRSFIVQPYRPAFPNPIFTYTPATATSPAKEVRIQKPKPTTCMITLKPVAIETAERLWKETHPIRNWVSQNWIPILLIGFFIAVAATVAGAYIVSKLGWNK